MPLTRIKHTLKSKFAESRPSSKGRAFDIVNPARLFQWAIVLRRVRHAYLQAHEGRRLCLARPERYTDKMQWRKLFDLSSREKRDLARREPRVLLVAATGNPIYLPVRPLHLAHTVQ